ncbi:hypothetical protein [Nocardiopsis sp. MG754419]|uniref:hypothetical protein n=1 Tax=Nocardiopsis sp. MG754419 TaxID=2259865 RepID=UPI001BA5A24E|nr:hypothetical protein [Nocardiopsis sp. MG754419]MBR8744025.1 hypothetical protein [Nocardiopsis sp. MG754419]
MRRITPCALLLPLIIAATACTSSDREVALENPGETTTEGGPATESAPAKDPLPDTKEDTEPADRTAGSEAEPTRGFGEPAAFAHPVGAYEEEFRDGVEEDVVYTVDDVATDGAGSAGFALTVEVPELGRVFGLGTMTVECLSEGSGTPATGDDTVTEAEAGTHTMRMDCAVPPSADHLTVLVTNAEDEADWGGPLE